MGRKYGELAGGERVVLLGDVRGDRDPTLRGDGLGGRGGCGTPLLRLVYDVLEVPFE